MFLNNVYRGIAPPGHESAQFAVGGNNLKPLDITVRCSDGGVYSMQLEAVKDACVVTFDEEGNGIHAECTGEDTQVGGPRPVIDDHRDTDRGAAQIRVKSQLDDDCGVWVNGVLRARLPPVGDSGWIPTNRETVYRTNVLIRCEDGGVYGTSVEAIYTTCAFEVDEEGGGLHTVSCQ